MSLTLRNDLFSSDDIAYNNHDVDVSEGEIEESLRGEKGFGSSGK